MTQRIAVYFTIRPSFGSHDISQHLRAFRMQSWRTSVPTPISMLAGLNECTWGTYSATKVPSTTYMSADMMPNVSGNGIHNYAPTEDEAAAIRDALFETDPKIARRNLMHAKGDRVTGNANGSRKTSTTKPGFAARRAFFQSVAGPAKAKQRSQTTLYQSWRRKPQKAIRSPWPAGSEYMRTRNATISSLF